MAEKILQKAEKLLSVELLRAPHFEFKIPTASGLRTEQSFSHELHQKI